ncbi:MAG: outer membrane beta-barrel family protein [Rikenellaceae bacterium]
MYKNLLTFILTLLICASVSAQTDIDIKNRYKISGQIVEASSEKAVPYTTIRVLNIRKETVTVEASDILGYFSLNVKSPGSYLIKFDAMGYGTDSLTVNITEPVNNIGIIKLAEGQQLTGVTVSAKKLIMKQEVDKLVYDVTNDPEAKRLKMADIMKKIPFMTINALDGKLKYLDNTISTILINGKPNEMISGGRQFPMRLIKGDVMSNIEIIMPGTKDNPGDKPIINIKLARELPNGYATELKANGNTQNAISGNIDVITKIDKLYLSLVYGISNQNRPRLETLTTKENLNVDASIYLQNNNSVSWGNNISHRLGVGASYQITKKDNIGLSLSANKSVSNNYINTLSDNYDIQNELIDYQNSKSVNKSNSTPKVNGSFNYRHALEGMSFLSVSYSLTNSLNNSGYTLLTNKSNLTDPDYQISKGNNSTVDQSATFVISKRYGTKHLIEANGSYTNREYSNSSDFEYWNYDNQNLENYSFSQEGLNYTQDVYRAYGRYIYMGKNILINFRLSAEQMINKGIFFSTENSNLDYKELNIFPSLGIVYRTKHKYKIGIAYKTRTLRPNINYLNPFVDNSDPKNIIMGNPKLKAEYAHNFEFTVDKNFGNNINFALFSTAEFINNAIERVTTINNQNISATTYENIDNKGNYFARMSLNIKPFPWLSVYNAGRVYYAKYTNTLTGMKSNMTGFGYWGFFNVNLFKCTSIGGSIDISPQINSAQTKEVKYYTLVEFYLSQTLVKDKLFMTLSFDEPFKRHRYISNVIGNNSFNMTTTREEPGRVLGFRLTWNFGLLKDKSSIPGSESVPSDLVRPVLPTK